MVVKVLDAVFAILSGFNLNLQLVGQIVAGGYDAFQKVKEALSNVDEPTLEQIAEAAAKLREPVDL